MNNKNKGTMAKEDLKKVTSVKIQVYEGETIHDALNRIYRPKLLEQIRRFVSAVYGDPFADKEEDRLWQREK